LTEDYNIDPCFQLFQGVDDDLDMDPDFFFPEDDDEDDEDLQIGLLGWR
jgi:hypothetical protein